LTDEKQLSPQESFQKKLTDRIRKDIGELMPDEAITEAIQRAMEDAFFKPRKVHNGRTYGQQYDEHPPWIVDLVKELLEPKVKEAVEEWIGANPEEVKKIVAARLDEGLGSAMIKAVDSLFQNQLFALQSGVEQRIQELRGGQ
jgi:hypothetical protein